ncbi:MAG: hypothetical protein LBL49_10400 [Clostridiales Family XIII bacterium]|jgi:hypothetical protein|nr:hypothetical protein [Clostridiales Family XIII bacterium]
MNKSSIMIISRVSILALALIMVLFFLFLFLRPTDSITAADIEESMDAVSADIDNAIKSDSNIGFSSNPYDYIGISPEYERLVSLGPNALPVIKTMIQDSPNGGLEMYILATAAEEISKTYLKQIAFEDSGQTWGWATAKEWEKEFSVFVSELPTRLTEIQNSDLTSEEKLIKIETLGVMVIPLLIEEVRTGDEQYIPVIAALLDETAPTESTKDLAKARQNEIDWLSAIESKYADVFEMEL